MKRLICLGRPCEASRPTRVAWELSAPPEVNDQTAGKIKSFDTLTVHILWQTLEFIGMFKIATQDHRVFVEKQIDHKSFQTPVGLQTCETPGKITS